MNRNKQEHMVTTQINLSFTISKVQFNKTKYKSSLTIQVEFNPIEFVLLNFNQILTGRQLNFISIKSNSVKVGINSLANRLTSIKNTPKLAQFVTGHV